MRGKKMTQRRCGEETLCVLTCCLCNLDIKKITPPANKPRFICKSLG